MDEDPGCESSFRPGSPWAGRKCSPFALTIGLLPALAAVMRAAPAHSNSSAQALRSVLQKYLMVPRLISLSRAVPGNREVAWDRYWAGIHRTGLGGEVLWDAGNENEITRYLQILQRHLDPRLPVVDVGCGHGAITRSLAASFPQVLGVDVSARAVERARAESAGRENPGYLVRDMTAPGAGTGLIGPTGANVFVRGLLHVLERADQVALARNLRDLAGERGTVFLAETNFRGNSVEYVARLGATRRHIPAPLERAIRQLPIPGHFGPVERATVFPPKEWELLEDGPTTIETNPMTGTAGTGRIPGYYAVLRARQGPPCPGTCIRQRQACGTE